MEMDGWSCYGSDGSQASTTAIIVVNNYISSRRGRTAPALLAALISSFHINSLSHGAAKLAFASGSYLVCRWLRL